MTTSLENTLVRFYNLSTQAEKDNVNKKMQPLLVLRTINGEKQIQMIDNRSQLPLFQRILASLGFGEASLSNVANFLSTKKWSNLDNMRDPLRLLDIKISHRNSHSWIQKIKALLPFDILKVATYAKGESTTYHPAGSTPAEDALGILDFSHVFPECGAGYVADGTGHGKAEKRPRLYAIWDHFNQKFPNMYRERKFEDKDQIRQFMRGVVLQSLDVAFANIGTASTFSLAILMKMKEKNYVASLHVGDSSLLHLTKAGRLRYLTPRGSDDKINKQELSSLGTNSPFHFAMDEVQSGDSIFGLTDGITDFLPAETLHTMLQTARTSENLLKTIEDTILEKADKATFDPQNKNKSDDISVFMMIVP